jgi:hypothetical protein
LRLGGYLMKAVRLYNRGCHFLPSSPLPHTANHKLSVSNNIKLHTSTALRLRTEPPAPTGQETGCDTENVCKVTKKNSIFVRKCIVFWAVPWVRRLDASLLPLGTGFDSGSLHVGFVVDKVALGQVFPQVLRFSPVNLIPSVLHYLEKDKK